jgi:dynein heavy chain
MHKIDDILNYINTLPNSDHPEVFGLHSNASITYQTNVANSILNNIMNIQPKQISSSSTTSQSRETVVNNIASDMLEKLPVDYVVHEVKACFSPAAAIAPMNIFLKQEIDRIQKVISIVRRTLLDLKLAIEGTIVMNESLSNSLDFIYDSKVPDSWQKVILNIN